MTDKKNPGVYTREELTIFANGIAALANRVIKQWELDGKPSSCTSIINDWRKLSEFALSLETSRVKVNKTDLPNFECTQFCE